MGFVAYGTKELLTNEVRLDDMRTYVLTQSEFGQAAAAWLEDRKPFIGARTYRDYSYYIITLTSYFSAIKLPEITPDQIDAYQKMRMARAGASIINHECSVLQQMLKRIGKWQDIGHRYQPLPLPKKSPHRTLTQQEEELLYRIGAQHPEWEAAFAGYVLGMNTTMHCSEIRHIQLKHIDMNHQEGPRVFVEHGKTEKRRRWIPLNGKATRMMAYLVERAERLGSIHADDYLLPFRINRGFYDPRRPCTSWRTAMDKLLAAANIKITPYSFRHHAITVLYENPEISDETLEQLAGTIPVTLKRHYSHIRMNAKRKAVEALERVVEKSYAAEPPWKQRK